MLIGVNLSQNPFNISFPGSTWKCAWGGSAVSKGGRACQWYSNPLTGNKANLTFKPLSHVGLTPPLNPLPLIRGGAVLAQDKTGVGWSENWGQV